VTTYLRRGGCGAVGQHAYRECDADIGVSGGNVLPFALSATSAGGVELPMSSPGTALGITRNGTNQTAVLYGRITSGNFKSLPAGSYATSVSLTVEY